METGARPLGLLQLCCCLPLEPVQVQFPLCCHSVKIGKLVILTASLPLLCSVTGIVLGSLTNPNWVVIMAWAFAAVQLIGTTQVCTTSAVLLCFPKFYPRSLGAPGHAGYMRVCLSMHSFILLAMNAACLYDSVFCLCRLSALEGAWIVCRCTASQSMSSATRLGVTFWPPLGA